MFPSLPKAISRRLFCFSASSTFASALCLHSCSNQAYHSQAILIRDISRFFPWLKLETKKTLKIATCVRLFFIPCNGRERISFLSSHEFWLQFDSTRRQRMITKCKSNQDEWEQQRLFCKSSCCFCKRASREERKVEDVMEGEAKKFNPLMGERWAQLSVLIFETSVQLLLVFRFKWFFDGKKLPPPLNFFSPFLAVFLIWSWDEAETRAKLISRSSWMRTKVQKFSRWIHSKALSLIKYLWIEASKVCRGKLFPRNYNWVAVDSKFNTEGFSFTNTEFILWKCFHHQRNMRLVIAKDEMCYVYLNCCSDLSLLYIVL